MSSPSPRHEPSAAPFRPRLARVVATALAALVTVATAVAVVGLPSEGVLGAALLDRTAIGGLGLLIAWFCLRQAGVAAFVDDEGLRVRNLLLSRRVAWADVVSVRFGQGRPWVQLDLADGDTLAVMGIQRADGAFAEAEARRLATLVARRTRTTRDD